MRKILFFGFLFVFSFSEVFSAQVTETTKLMQIDYSKSTIRTRFQPPKGYVWKKEEKDSFADFITNLPLLPPNFPVRDYRGIPVNRQDFHVGIINIDVGEKNLQQCADAWIRLYAEYLWEEKKYDDITFDFTSGQPLSWKDFEKGIRTIEIGDRVKFVKTAKPDSSYQNFRKYLDLVFQYAGTISLDRQSVEVKSNDDIRVGDFLITPGSPGHSVIIVGIAKNNMGKRLYLLAESYMPAQDIHIIKNPWNPKISPWYELNVNAPQTMTAKYTFKPTSIKRFYQLERKD